MHIKRTPAPPNTPSGHSVPPPIPTSINEQRRSISGFHICFCRRPKPYTLPVRSVPVSSAAVGAAVCALDLNTNLPSAIGRGRKKRKRVADGEVEADMKMMGLGWMEGDGSLELSDLNKGFGDTASSSSSSSSGGALEGIEWVKNTPPTPWLEGNESVTEDPSAVSAGFPAGGRRTEDVEVEEKKAEKRDSRRKGKEKAAEQIDEQADRYVMQDVNTTNTTSTTSSRYGNKSRTYDQDEIVRREQAGLPEKRSRKPRQVFGEDANTQWCRGLNGTREKKREHC